ncbi:hypothetical protein J6590_012636, partial [Homalodisca vitripennis]
MADYRKYASDIERAEFKNFYPISKQYLNEPNKRTEFNIDFGDNFCSSNFQFYISGTLTKQDGQAYLETDNKNKSRQTYGYPATANVEIVIGVQGQIDRSSLLRGMTVRAVAGLDRRRATPSPPNCRLLLERLVQ